ncbi:hypothetical protein RHMOL_Rhmol06G0128500 [Rhododendron molle]|uniref:Uncharacterized protein n=1 Tax=Rhododendron molle TaxID=49168 RepID=A0ACC0NCA2_RHOML|nr:hypothetical protein RHMOL_Rhmol06G0128500 [Rhododendron molle]
MSTIFIAVQCEAPKEEQQQVDLRGLQREAVRAEGVCPRFHGQRRLQFVQTFNMSRCQFEQQRTNETLDLVPEHTDDQPRSSNDKKRRSDWSEYVDPKDIHDGQEEEEQEEDVFGPRIVTELPPKELFKKPKLNADSSGFGTTKDGESNQRWFRNSSESESQQVRSEEKLIQQQLIGLPRGLTTSQSEEGISAAEGPQRSFAKGDSNRRTYTKQLVEDGFAESRACHPTTAKVSSTKWGAYIIQDNNKDSEDKGPWKSQLRMVKGASKWDVTLQKMMMRVTCVGYTQVGWITENKETASTTLEMVSPVDSKDMIPEHLFSRTGG